MDDLPAIERPSRGQLTSSVLVGPKSARTCQSQGYFLGRQIGLAEHDGEGDIELLSSQA
jgi:hypothetical protein